MSDTPNVKVLYKIYPPTKKATKHIALLKRIKQLEYELQEAKKRRMMPEDISVGFWLSAALSDKNVCAEYKEDIKAWFGSFEPLWDEGE